MFSSSQLSELEQQGASEKSRLEQRVSELERSLEEQQPPADLAAEVSRLSLRRLPPHQTLLHARRCYNRGGQFFSLEGHSGS